MDVARGEGSGAEEGAAVVKRSTCTVLYTHTEGPELQAPCWAPGFHNLCV